MKMLLAGEWAHEIYEKSCADALMRIGVDVEAFRFGRYFSGPLGRLERWSMTAGPCTRRMNDAIIRAVSERTHDVVFVWRGVQLLPDTLRRLRSKCGLLVSYNNDDPFSAQYARSKNLHQRRLWKHFTEGLPVYHLNFVYRLKNVRDYESAGASTPGLLLPYFVPTAHHPVPGPKGRDFDGVFVGHYEPDERYPSIAALRAAGIRVKIHGTGWGGCPELGDERRLITAARGEQYSEVVSSAHFALSFYSKLNSDTYTRRVFELPAMATVLVSTRTPEMNELFADGTEAILFSDAAELVDRV